jgi:hypothetical protein
MEEKMLISARIAAELRLAGRIKEACRWDRAIEGLYAEAAAVGVDEDSLVEAEERGRESARSRIE